MSAAATDAVRAVSAQELAATSDCATPSCPHAADGADGLCHICRAPRPAAVRPAWTDPLGLAFDARLDLDAWHAALRRAARARSATTWWVADLVANSELPLELKVRLAVEELGIPESSVRTWEWCARKVSRERRRPELAFAHHQEVAALKPAEQERWLAATVEGRWGVRRLRAELENDRRRRKAERAAASQVTDEQVAEVYTEAQENGRPPVQAVAEHFGVPRTTASARVVRARRRGQLSENGASENGASEHAPDEQLEQLRLTIVLRSELAARLRTLALDRDASVSEVAAEILERHLGRLPAS